MADSELRDLTEKTVLDFTDHVPVQDDATGALQRTTLATLGAKLSAPVSAVNDFGLATTNTGTDNVSRLQSFMDELTNTPQLGVIGGSGLGHYPVEGSVIVADCASNDNFGFTVDARQARFHHVGADPFITTRTFTDLNDAANTTSRRTRRKWQGGFFQGNNTAGSKCFDLISWNFAEVDDVFIRHFDRGVYGEFCLNSKVQSSTITANEYCVYFRDGTMTGSTPANSASNMAQVERVRVLGSCTNGARIRFANSGAVVVRDCTSEGSDPPIHVDFYDRNTSGMQHTVENLWIESDATVAGIRINTYHNSRIGVGHYLHNAVSPLIQVISGDAIELTSLPYMVATAQPFFDAQDGRWFFTGPIGNGRFDPRDGAHWVGGSPPGGVYAMHGDAGTGNPKLVLGGAIRAVSGSRAASEGALADLLYELDRLGVIDDITTT